MMSDDMLTIMKRLSRAYLCFYAALLVSGCAAAPISPSKTPSTLAPRGPDAAHLAELWWVMLAFGTAIFVLVTVLLAAALLRGRRATSTTVPESSGGDVGRRWLVWGGFAL